MKCTPSNSSYKINMRIKKKRGINGGKIWLAKKEKHNTSRLNLKIGCLQISKLIIKIDNQWMHIKKLGQNLVDPHHKIHFHLVKSCCKIFTQHFKSSTHKQVNWYNNDATDTEQIMIKMKGGGWVSISVIITVVICQS